MTEIRVNFDKSYEEQSENFKAKFCKHDFNELKNLLEFRKKVLTNKN